MIFEMEQEEDGRWIAKIPTLSGVMLYDQGLKEAISKLQTLALMVLVERLENGETPSMLVSVTLNAA
ncbi:type II toxin-antitoxin system HicB family antitoxin [Acaryochloris sp. CCMEE 5410]|nr:type II toxin-antitoxin system HicB family antitoxin [Acaryochloris sp. CCMEE 5410]